MPKLMAKLNLRANFMAPGYSARVGASQKVGCHTVRQAACSVSSPQRGSIRANGRVVPRPGCHDEASGLRQPNERWLALDRLRAVAVLFMIEGHSTTALMRPNELPAFAKRLHEVLHGLTAPAFLFGAGLAFGTATYARYERFRQLGDSVRRRLSRYGALFLIGYALQLPGWSLWAALRGADEQLESMCRVGPLQLIAVVLALAQLAITLVPTPRAHATLAAVLGVVVMAVATPLTRSTASEQLGVFLGAFVRDTGGSHFPLFPWSAFVLLGIGAAGVMYERALLRRRLPWALSGAVMAASAYVVYRASSALQEPGWFWRTSASYLLFRLGLVAVVLGLLHRTDDSRRADDLRRGAGFRTGWTLLAHHSLAAYVVHIVLLFGSPLTPGLTRIWGKALGLPHALIAGGSVLAVTFGAVLLLERVDRALSGNAQRLRAGLALLILAVMMR